jgi:anaerobic magnesium-protoporphyrin IX monomethyl ester cyclase
MRVLLVNPDSAAQGGYSNPPLGLAYPQVDICTLGEGEQTLLEIAQGRPLAEITGIVWRQGQDVIKNPPRCYAENLDTIPFPAWHLLPLLQYPARGQGVFSGIDLNREPRISVVFSRGCSANCSFCSTWRIWRGHRSRSAANMADELELLNKQHGIKC